MSNVYEMFQRANEPRETYVDRGDPKTRPLSYIKAYSRSTSYETAQRRHEKKMKAERRRPKSARGPRSRGGGKGGKRRARSRPSSPRKAASVASAPSDGAASAPEDGDAAAEAPRRHSVGAPAGGRQAPPAAAPAAAPSSGSAVSGGDDAHVVWHGGPLTKFRRSPPSVFSKCGGGGGGGGSGGATGSGGDKPSGTRYFLVEKREKKIYVRWAPREDSPPGKWKEVEILSVEEECGCDSELGFTLVTPEGQPDLEVMAPSDASRGEWLQYVRFACRSNRLMRKTSSVVRSANA